MQPAVSSSVDGAVQLSPTQLRRRGQILKAARDLAEEGGYKAVTMASVAERAKTTRVTVYHYFSNKDHLLAEVVLLWSQDLVKHLRSDPLHGDSTPDKIARRFEQLVRLMWREPKLVDSVLASFVSTESGTLEATERLHGLVSIYLTSALEDHELDDYRDVERIIGHLFFSVLLHLCTGRFQLEEAVSDLKVGIHIICGQVEANAA